MGQNALEKLKNIARDLPKEIEGWNKLATSEVYSSQNLYEYINGGAELYISYQFKHLLTQNYTDPDSNEVRIDLFDMGSSYNAYGIFSHGREAVDHFVAPDVESEYAPGLLTFWKGRYYVSVFSYPETEKKKRLVKILSGMIAGRITEKSEKPPIIGRLPDEGLKLASIRYFRHFTWMNSYGYIVDKDYLNFDANTHAVIAKYNFTESGSKSCILILIEYQDSDQAHAARQRFLKNVLPDAHDGFKGTEDSGWAGCTHDDTLIAIVWYAPDITTAKRLLTGSKKRSKNPETIEKY